MARLGLQLKLNDLTDEDQPLGGQLAVEMLDEALVGLVGELGYRALDPAAVQGAAHRRGTNVMVQADYAVSVGYDCVRCLSPRALGIRGHLRHVMSRGTTPKAALDGVIETLDDIADADVSYYTAAGDGAEIIDISPVIREYIVLELPMNPVCADADEEPCRLREGAGSIEPDDNEGQRALASEIIDPRWAPLLEIKKKLS